MKSKLIQKEQYQRLLKMSVPEIAKFLQETEYKREIDELAVSQLGIQQVEKALNKNLVRAFRKLKRIAEGNLRLLIEEYLRKKDISNLKAIFRGKFTKADEEYVDSLLIPVGQFNRAYLLQLLKKESVEDIARSIPLIDLRKATEAFKEQHNLFEIENALDKHFYSHLIAFTQQIPQEGNLFRAFLEHEIDILNMKTILRLKREGFPAEEIQSYLFFSGARLKKNTLIAMTIMPSVQEVIDTFSKYGYSRVLASAEKQNSSVMDVEIQLNHYLLNRAALLLHQNPLSIDVILGYMFAKEIEIRNLKTIIKGKQLGVDDAFIAKELVFAK